MGKFTKNFLWGSSTNAQQFEGAYNEGGKGLSIADVRNGFFTGDEEESEIGCFDSFKTASDHYHHLEEDIDLLGEMGFGIYRFSMAWSRIFPNGDDETPNQEGLDFYERMITLLEKHHIKVVCTLYAYDLPLALVNKYQGFLSREVVEAYCRYVDTVSKYFKGRIHYYVPFNEQNTMLWIPKYCAGVEPQNAEERFRLDHHLNLSYAKAVRIIHENDSDAKVGGNICNTCNYPATCNPRDVEAADTANFKSYAYADVFCRGQYPKYYLNSFGTVDFDSIILPGDMEEIALVKPDFLSLTYYMSNVCSGEKGSGDTLLNTRMRNKYLKTTEWGWFIDPYGFYHYLMDFYHRYQMPILVLENGLGHTDNLTADYTIHDDYRIDYLKNHIEWMEKAIENGVEMIGYCTWSAIDLYSTHEGFEKRYGFVYVDKYTLKRYKKDSFYWYKNLITNNGLE